MRVLSASEMAAVDRAAQSRIGIPGLVLMEEAAAGCVRMIEEEFPGWRAIVVACGPGNNGGDGLAIARLLAGKGREARVFLLGDPERLRGDAATNRDAWRRTGREVCPLSGQGALAPFAEALGSADGVVDALFGTGLSRPLSGTAARVVREINRSGRPVLAVDVPSGLSGDSAAVREPVVRAAATAAIAAPKLCHVIYPARGCCGEVAVVDIGIPDSLIEIPRHRVHLVSADAVAQALPPRLADSHKGDFGHVAVVAGSVGKAGAAALAARAALRAGAGMVTVLTPASVEPRLTPALPEAMTLPLPEQGGAVAADAADLVIQFLKGCDAALLGPGLGTAEGTRRAVERIVREAPVPVVLDADAINLFAGRPAALARRRLPTVLTPHPGEAGRLLGRRTATVQADRPAAAREMARRTRSVCVLKGAGTLTATPDGEVFVNPTGGSILATAGSGDVLGGILAALLAGPLEAVDAAVCAVFLHGLAGERVAALRGNRGALASEFADILPEVIARLGEA